MPKTTIVTAAYLDSPEKVRWLREAGENIMAQEFEDWEWIVVDDHSPAGLDLPSDVRVRHDGLRTPSQLGPAKCRNTGVALARTDSVVVLDADDMFAESHTLGTLHETWEKNQGHFVYGDIQHLSPDGQRLKPIKFKPYSFKGSLELKGVIPVTAMMSVECWHRAGGWKPEFDAGLEDVEFWISAGAAGFCGIRLDEIVLLYRKHPQSRTQRMRATVREQAMRAMIRERHAELFEGRYPVGCCGGGRSRPVAVSDRMQARTPTDLEEKEGMGARVWVRYNGHQMAEIQVKGQGTGEFYKIKGTGHEFRIWVRDAHTFQSLGRGKHFTVGIAPPARPEPEPEPEPDEPTFQAPEPELATVEKLDPVAQALQEPEPKPPPLAETEPITFQGPDELDAEIEAIQQKKPNPLEKLTKANASVKAILEAEGWTLATLARANVKGLVPYPGIGKVTAANLIAEANKLWHELEPSVATTRRG